MSDFIFSKRNLKSKKITKEIHSIYKVDKPVVHEFHGDWGSLGVSQNLYNGFNPYEDEEYIATVIGGPILTFQNNSFLTEEASSKGTTAIFQRWLKGNMKWDEDLSGPFVILIVNKKTDTLICITDLMSFIPVYIFEDETDLMLSTHVDMVARISKQSDKVDVISELDFILHGVVTYPYTIYKNISQMAPASEHKFLIKLKSTNYWIPKDEETNMSINNTAKQLRMHLKGYINKVVSESSNIAQFISAGEDSRTLSGLLSEYKRDAFIFLDQMNREGKTARKVANIYGADFKLFTRDKLHYLNILSSCSDLVGSGSQYHHAHTYGFHKKSNLNSYTAVFGGLFSDALLKGARIKKIRRTGKLPFIPEIKNKNYSTSDLVKNSIFKEDALVKLTKRRKAHLKYIKKFRGESAEEWFELWPSSMNMNIPNLHANRRLFRSYEPFMCNDVVKTSASIPQKWKLNRKLFHKMAKPLLKPSKRVMHGDGWNPYYSWKHKSFVYPFILASRKLGRNLGINKGNQGPWGEWNAVTSSEEWLNKLERYSSGLELLKPVLVERDIFKIIESKDLDISQHINLLQILYLNARN